MDPLDDLFLNGVLCYLPLESSAQLGILSMASVRVVKPNLLFCIHQRNSEGVCRSEWESGRLSRS